MAWDYNPETGEEVWIPDETEIPVPDVAFEPAPNQGPVPDDVLSSLFEKPEIQLKEQNPLSTPTQPSSSRVKVGGSSSLTALDKDTLGYMETKGMRGYQAQDAQAFNKATAQANEMLQPFTEASAAQKETTSQIGQLEADRAAMDAKFKGDYEQKLNEHAIETNRIYEDVNVKTRQYAADYETQLKQLSAMGVNPGRLYANMTKGEKAGTLFSAFISDFLGAKGIKTKAMDYINQAIDRDIDAQVNAINTKGKVVDGFRQMWDMQRAQSSSDFEAKMRMKGFQLEAFKMGIAAKLGQMDSDIARAQIPLALAAIDEKQAKVKADVIKYRSDQYNQEAQRNVSLRGQNIQASIARNAQSVELEKARATAMANKVSQMKETVVRVAETDAQGNRTGRVVGFAPTKERAKELQETTDATQRSLDSLERLRNLQKSQGGDWTYFGKKLTEDKAKAELTSIYNDMISDIALAKTGKAGNEQEYARLRSIVPENDFVRGVFNSGNGGDIAAYAGSKWGIREIESRNKTLVANLTAPTPEEAEYFKGGTSGDVFAPYKTSNETFDAPKPPETKVDSEIKRITRPGNGELSNAKPGDGFYEDVLAIYESIDRLDNVSQDKPRYRDGKNLPVDSTLSANRPPAWMKAMDDLAIRAVHPDASPEEKTRAIEFLVGIISEPEIGPVEWQGGSGDFDVEAKKAAAEYYLNEITNAGNQ